MQENKEIDYCYIRRNDGRGWVKGKKHHYDALISFINTPSNSGNDPVYINVPHENGGDFEANFKRSGQLNNDNHLSSYVDDYGNFVVIMLCKPEFAAYINRIIDYY